MNLIGNIIWLVFGGFFAAIGYVVGGLLTCLTIVGLPFGLQSIKLGVASLTPFGKELVPATARPGMLRVIFDLLWLALFGWEIAMIHLSAAAVLAVTLVGIPFAIQHIKLIPVALFPFNYELE